MKVQSKKGFTLVELLAVIVVLAIIMIIAVPSVLSAMENARKGTFKVEARKIINTAMGKRQANELVGKINDGAVSGTEDEVSFYCYTFSSVDVDTGGKYKGVVRYYPASNVWKIKMNDGTYETDGFKTATELDAEGSMKDATTVSEDYSKCSE